MFAKPYGLDAGKFSKSLNFGKFFLHVLTKKRREKLSSIDFRLEGGFPS